MNAADLREAAILREAAARKHAVADALREQGHEEPDADADHLIEFLALRGMRVVATGEGR